MAGSSSSAEAGSKQGNSNSVDLVSGQNSCWNGGKAELWYNVLMNQTLYKCARSSRVEHLAFNQSALVQSQPGAPKI